MRELVFLLSQILSSSSRILGLEFYQNAMVMKPDVVEGTTVVLKGQGGRDDADSPAALLT